jgi:hypothetical protein
MRKIVDYYLIAAKGLNKFDERMKTDLQNGWQPFGSPSYADNFFIQAMVKYEDEDTEDIKEAVIRMENPSRTLSSEELKTELEREDEENPVCLSCDTKTVRFNQFSPFPHYKYVCPACSVIVKMECLKHD